MTAKVAAASLTALLACSSPGCGATDPGDPGPEVPAHCAYASAPPSPWAPPAPGSIAAGAGQRPIDVPIGTPLGGYADRNGSTFVGGEAVDDRDAPLAGVFVPSVGIQTRPRVLAVALEAGGSMLVLVKLDLGVAAERLVFDLEGRLSVAVPGDLDGRVIVTASHTHAGWAGFYPGVAMYAGFDRFQPSVYARVLDAAEAAARDAIGSMEPARLGVGIWGGWDPRDAVYEDRRDENDHLQGGPSKEDRLSVLRIDRMDDTPLAVLFSFPIHGTIGKDGNAIASVDAPGHIELEVEERLGAGAVAVHLQTATGDARPTGRGGLSSCAGRFCEADFARMEALGELAAPSILSLRDDVATSPTGALVVATRTIPLGRSIAARGGALSYAPFDPEALPDRRIWNGDGSIRTPIDEFNAPHGAPLCGEREGMFPVAQIPGTDGLAPYASCIDLEPALPLLRAIFEIGEEQHLPLCDTTRTTMTAVRIAGIPIADRTGSGAAAVTADDDVVIATVPGEPVSPWSGELRARSPLGPDRTLVLGYAQGHLGYVLTVEDWLQGGFEPSINMWGPIEGEYLLERALELAAEAASDQPTESPEVDRLLWEAVDPVEPVPDETPGAGTTPSAIPDTLVAPFGPVPASAQPAGAIRRVIGVASFVFEGADPLRGTPVVRLEREVEGEFIAVERASGRAVDSDGPEILLTHTPEPLRTTADARHLYLVRWQAAADIGEALDAAFGVPTGRYRFRAVGPGFDLTSDPFDVTGAGALVTTAQLSAGKLSGSVAFDVESGYRLLRLDGPSDGMVPATGPIEIQLVSVATGDIEPITGIAVDSDGRFGPIATSVDASAGISYTVADRFGNSATGEVNP